MSFPDQNPAEPTPLDAPPIACSEAIGGFFVSLVTTSNKPHRA